MHAAMLVWTASVACGLGAFFAAEYIAHALGILDGASTIGVVLGACVGAILGRRMASSGADALTLAASLLGGAMALAAVVAVASSRIPRRPAPGLYLELHAMPPPTSENEGWPVGSVLALTTDAAEPGFVGWIVADGRSLPKRRYRKLYQALGSAYDVSGDETSFRLPDYSGQGLALSQHCVTFLGLSLRGALVDRSGFRNLPITWLIRADD